MYCLSDSESLTLMLLCFYFFTFLKEQRQIQTKHFNGRPNKCWIHQDISSSVRVYSYKKGVFLLLTVRVNPEFS